MASTKRTEEALNQAALTFENPITGIASKLDSRPAKDIEKKTNGIAKSSFDEVQTEGAERKKIRKSQAELMLERLKQIEQISALDLQLLIHQIQTLIAKDDRRMLSPHFMKTAEISQGKSDKLAEEQASTKVTIATAVGAAATVMGAFLQAAKVTGTALPFGIGSLIPAILQVAEPNVTNPLIAIGQAGQAASQITTNMSQAEQQKLRHLYQWTEERLKDIERLKNQASQEERKTLDQLSQQLEKLHRAISELLSRQS